MALTCTCIHVENGCEVFYEEKTNYLEISKPEKHIGNPYVER